MAELKTKPNQNSAFDFIKTIPDLRKQEDSMVLLDLLKSVTSQQPRMWGSSIIGFGMYHYKSKRSSQEGDWPLIAFSPRKQNLTLYITFGFADCTDLLKKLGKHKTSKACLYINKLSDVDVSVIKRLLKKSYVVAKKTLL